MTRIAVDVERLTEFVERLRHTQAQLARAGNDADARIRQLHAGWSGRAAQAQAAAHQQWLLGAAQVHDAITVLHSIAHTARGNYASAVGVNRRMWLNV